MQYMFFIFYHYLKLSNLRFNRPKMKIVEFANSVDPDDVAHNDRSLQSFRMIHEKLQEELTTQGTY